LLGSSLRNVKRPPSFGIINEYSVIKVHRISSTLSRARNWQRVGKAIVLFCWIENYLLSSLFWFLLFALQNHGYEISLIFDNRVNLWLTIYGIWFFFGFSLWLSSASRHVTKCKNSPLRMLYVALHFVNTESVPCRDFPALSRLAVTDRPFFTAIFFSGIDDNSAVMTRNTGEQTLFVVFGASVSDSFDIYADFVCRTFASSILQNFPLAKY